MKINLQKSILHTAFVSKSLFMVLTFSLLLSNCEKDDEEVKVLATEVQFNLETQSSTFNVVFKLTVSANKPITEVGIIWADHSSVTSNDAKISNIQLFNGSSTTALPDLTPGKTYYAKLYAIVKDETFYGDEVSFTTSTPTVTSVQPATTGRYGTLSISGENFPYPSKVSDFKVFLDGVELPVVLDNNGHPVAQVTKDVPFGTGKKLTVVIKGFSVDVETPITINHLTRLQNVYSNEIFTALYTGGKPYVLMTDVMYSYDLTKNQWSSSDLNTPFNLNAFNAFVIGNEVFVGLGSEKFSLLDINSKALTSKTNIPGGSTYFYRRGTALTINGKGYYGFDYCTEDQISWTKRKRFYSYDPEKDEWTEESDHPLEEGIISPASFAIGNEAFICGGHFYNGSAFPSNYTREFWSYNVTSKGWTKYPDYPGPLDYSNAGFSYKGKGYIVGGGEIWVFDPSENTWSKFDESLPAAPTRYSTYVIPGENGIYMGAGKSGNNNQSLSDFYLFIPE